eukprot:767444-Hanusia_phi.AAC.16
MNVTPLAPEHGVKIDEDPDVQMVDGDGSVPVPCKACPTRGSIVKYQRGGNQWKDCFSIFCLSLPLPFLLLILLLLLLRTSSSSLVLLLFNFSVRSQVSPLTLTRRSDRMTGSSLIVCPPGSTRPRRSTRNFPLLEIPWAGKSRPLAYCRMRMKDLSQAGPQLPVHGQGSMQGARRKVGPSCCFSSASCDLPTGGIWTGKLGLCPPAPSPPPSRNGGRVKLWRRL